MKALIYDWSEKTSYLNKSDIKESFQKLAVDYDAFLFDLQTGAEEELKNYFKEIQAGSYDFCFSVNYFPELSNACMAYHLKYISWGYDCPFNVVDIEDTLGNPCNYVFCFDRIQAEGYIKKGFDTVFYLPLGINAERYKRMDFDQTKIKKYAGDISFIGSLYEGDYPGIAEICSEHDQGYFEAVINAQQILYGAYILNDVIDRTLVDSVNAHFKELDASTKLKLSKEQLVHVLDQETSRRERILLLNLLGRRFDTHLYTYQQYDLLQGVKIHGKVDYLTEMPLVFAASKINLNISVKGIQSGMPQRALDIMASGGFLLSNFQPELVEYFQYGEEVMVYESMEDAVVKCQFYLENEDLRRKIAEKGRERVLSEHNMLDKIRLMIEVAEIE